MKNRTYARELAMRELYRLDLLDEEVDLRSGLKEKLAKRAQEESVVRFATDLICGYFEKALWIDETIEKFLTNWNIDRIPYIDRQILRLATYELFFCDDIPHKVTLNEAVEMGKRYGTEKSGAFINGVLDKMHSERDQLISTLP